MGLFEVEYSTPIYSRLLRFNDILLSYPEMRPSFKIISDYSKKALFAKQVNRPTFRLSGLDKICTFLDYTDVYRWHNRISRQIAEI